MFKFLWWDLKNLNKGQIVRVYLSAAANVKLLDGDNYAKYKAGNRHRFFGGFANKTPYEIEVPHKGRWFLVVDLLSAPITAMIGGLFTGLKVDQVSVITTEYSALEQPFPRQEEAMATEPSNRYDVFLSHATEDKECIARPLKNVLEAIGLSVWFDDSQSDNLSKNGLRSGIDNGIYNSKYAVIILSPDYIRKQWTNREFDGFTAMEMAHKQYLICIWHNVTHDQVLKYSAPLANKYAHNTDKNSLEEIAVRIKETIIQTTP